MTSQSKRKEPRTPFVEEGSAFMELEGRQFQRPHGEAEPPDEDQQPAEPERYDVVVIGAGQAGLSVGYHLARRGMRFVILEAGDRIGDVWRARWDSLRLFTPAKFDALDGMAFPAPRDTFPTKDEMADYLKAYADRFDLPVRLRTKVERLSRDGDRYLVTAGGRRYEARHVVVAAASYQRPRVPEFAAELAPSIVQLHSSRYRNPSQLQDGDVLLVGAGNSGAEIAMDLASRHRVWLSGRNVGFIPFRIGGFLGRHVLVRLVIRGVFHRVLTVDTPVGRKARPSIVAHGGPLIRTRPRDLKAAGVERVGRVAGVNDGRPQLEDGRVLDVANVVWCTGFHPGLSWIDLPVFDDNGEPKQARGVVPGEPGLYVVGLHFLFSLSSTMIHGVGRDARRVVDAIAAREARTRAAA